jgi:membrane fusion protein, copper/silver efflux system
MNADVVDETRPPGRGKMGGRFGDGRAALLKSGAVGVMGGVVLLAAALLLQHLRHGWPFSVHHGLPSDVRSRPAAAARNPTPPGTGPGTHPRAAVTIEAGRADALGIRFERARKEVVSRPIRAVATVVPDESRVSHIHTRVAGWIEKLHVTTTGARVRAGAPLAEIFSQELLSSQNEHLAALRTAGAAGGLVVEAGRSRLRVLGMSAAEIDGLEQRGRPRPTVTVTSPRAGVLLHRGVAVGTAVDPSTEIATIADLDRVWVLAEIPEPDIQVVELGTPARIELPSSGRSPFEARVSFLSPTLSERTRTLRARFEVDNRDGRLRPGLYGTAELHTGSREALTVPRDAVVDTGLAQHVFVAARSPDKADRLSPRPVRPGVSLGDRIEIRSGLAEGEPVVASGVFLIDSESRLRASGGGTGHAHGQGASQGTEAPPAPPADQHEGHTAPPPGPAPRTPSHDHGLP